MSLFLEVEKKLSNFTVEAKIDAQNETVGILGHSGSGKSMTLKMIAGLVKPDRGEIVLNGETLFSSEKKINLRCAKRNTGLLFQNYALFPNMTVAENIKSCLSKNSRADYRDFLKRFHIEDIADLKPFEISGGQQQRAALARMMCTEPEIIMLDEPFSALDTDLKRTMENELNEFLKNYDKTAIIVSHNKEEILRLCDKVLIFNEGKAEIFDDTQTVFDNPPSIAAAKILGIKNTSPVKVEEGKITALNRDLVFPVNVSKDISFIALKSDCFKTEKKGGDFPIHLKINDIKKDSYNYILTSRNEKNGEFFTASFKNPDFVVKDGYVTLRINEKDIMFFKN